jgi:Polyketide cyclase / dehydrase and lipid transport
MVYLIILLAIAAFLFWVSRKSNHFELSRSTTIAATPEAIFPHINNLKAMNQWNPWATYNPKSVIAYEGPEEGPGAVYTWAGSKMGEGRFEITDSSTQAVKADLTMIKPMRANNKVTFSITPTDGQTRVTWHMQGTNSFMHKLMQTVMSMDKMVGGEFEKGLSALKLLVEQKKLN